MYDPGINRLPMEQRKRAFTKVIKIRPSQKEYIKSIKGRYSEAGQLDVIINFYRKYEAQSISKGSVIPEEQPN